jgi:hypothetical protein
MENIKVESLEGQAFTFNIREEGLEVTDYSPYNPVTTRLSNIDLVSVHNGIITLYTCDMVNDKFEVVPLRYKPVLSKEEKVGKSETEIHSLKEQRALEIAKRISEETVCSLRNC